MEVKTVPTVNLCDIRCIKKTDLSPTCNSYSTGSSLYQFLYRFILEGIEAQGNAKIQWITSMDFWMDFKLMRLLQCCYRNGTRSQLLELLKTFQQMNSEFIIGREHTKESGLLRTFRGQMILGPKCSQKNA